MSDSHRIEQHMLVRRVVASVAYANSQFDEAERQVLASVVSDIGGYTEADRRTLMEDASSLPSVESLVSSITEESCLRLLFVDLMTLAVTKEEWETTELSAVARVFGSVKWPRDRVERLQTAFDLLRQASY